MKLFTERKELQKEIRNINNISFVPTMGALHKGHVSLIKKSVNESKKTIVSIYVNPKQFESKNDYKKYPRSLKKDLDTIKKLKVNYLYKPTFFDIYKFKSKNKIFLDKFSKNLCGKYRKGHFRGVLDVVNRFIEIIKPRKIYLGNKDFQQLTLIKKHIKKNRINTKIVHCKTIRDKNFIAYSSRFTRLKKKERRNLVKIMKILKIYKRKLFLNINDKNLKLIKKKLYLNGVKKIDYIEPLDLKTLKKPKDKKKFNLFFALYIGKVRFIDNF